MLTTIRTRLVLGALLALFLPLAAGAQVSDPIQQEINALLAEIAALQQQLATLSITPAPAPTPVPSPAPAAPRVRCPSLYRDLSLGASGADIVALQSFLADEGFFHANATGFFGPITEASVQAWQSAQGVVRSGAPATTGWGVAGPRTRAAILNRCVVSANQPAPVPVSTTPTSCPLAPPPTTACSAGWQAITDGYGCTTSYKCSIPLSQPTPVPMPSTGAFSASPLSGPAPLSVRFTTLVSGIEYSIQFGDGAESPVLISSCTSAGIECKPGATHPYAPPGTYTARLLYAPKCPAGLACPAVWQELGQVTITVGGSTSGTVQ